MNPKTEKQHTSSIVFRRPNGHIRISRAADWLETQRKKARGGIWLCRQADDILGRLPPAEAEEVRAAAEIGADTTTAAGLAAGTAPHIPLSEALDCLADWREMERERERGREGGL